MVVLVAMMLLLFLMLVFLMLPMMVVLMVMFVMMLMSMARMAGLFFVFVKVRMFFFHNQCRFFLLQRYGSFLATGLQTRPGQVKY